MTKVDIAWYVTSAASMLFTFGLAPALLGFRIRKRKPSERRWLLGILISVVLTWLFLIAFRVTAEVPVLIARAEQRGDFEEDGVGGNAVILFAGWIIPLLGCLLFTALFMAVEKMKKPNQAPEPTAPSGRGSS